MPAITPSSPTRTYTLDGDLSGVRGVTADPDWGIKVYKGTPGDFPERLNQFRPAPYSWHELVERRINGDPAPVATPTKTFTARPWQDKTIEEIAKAGRGYVLTSTTGSGKTHMAIQGAIARGARRVLVIAPKSILKRWRDDIGAYTVGDMEWVVTNPEQLSRLLRDPDPKIKVQTFPRKERVAATAVRGVPAVDFDMVIADETQFLANPSSNRSRLWRRLVKWGDDGPEVFTLTMSATPFTAPDEIWAAAHLIAEATKTKCPDEMRVDSAWVPHLTGLGVKVIEGKRKKWRWHEHKRASAKVTSWLYQDGRGSATSAADIGLPTQERVLHPITLTPTERYTYNREWRNFRELMDLPVDTLLDIKPDSPLVERLRNVQKASLLKAPRAAEVIAQYVRDGYLVVVPTWYAETVKEIALRVSRELLHGTPSIEAYVAEVTGATPAEVQDKRIRQFQSGLSKVIVTSSIKAISLHAGEQEGGWEREDACDTKRVTVFMDVFTGGKNAFQAEGRAQRDGQKALAVYLYAENTTEEEWLASVFAAMGSTKALSLDLDEVDPATEPDLMMLRGFADKLRTKK